jgi:hypothetical protein
LTAACSEVSRRMKFLVATSALVTSVASIANAQYTATILPFAGFRGAEARSIAGGKIAGFAYYDSGAQDYRAAVWDAETGQLENINPQGWLSEAYGTDGVRHVGFGVSQGTQGLAHALLWNADGTVTDLHPEGFENSFGYAVSGNQQVGAAYFSGSFQARPILWSGSAASFVDLTPPGRPGGALLCTDGVTQGGGAGGIAGLWHGTPDSFASLHPQGFSSSLVRNMRHGEQVGSVSPDGLYIQAALWRGSAATFMSLHPSGAFKSELFDTNGLTQVGQLRMTTAGPGHAAAWQGSAAGSVDLATFLPPGYTWSTAYSVDELGRIVGAAQTSAGDWVPVLWSPVPELPGWISLAGLLGLALLRRARTA